jgi:hypothetical protein
LNLTIIDLQLLSTKFELVTLSVEVEIKLFILMIALQALYHVFHMCFWIEMILLQDKMGSKQCYMCCLLNKHLLFIERTLLYF